MKMASRWVFIIFSILYFEASAAIDCNPIAQFSHQGELRKNTIEFLPWAVEPTIKKAQINTVNCSEKKQLLNQITYQKLQELTAAGEPAFVVMKKKSDVIDSICLIEVYRIDEVVNREWRFQKDSCLQVGLIRAVDSDSKRFFYLSEEQASTLSLRMPASAVLKKRKSKK